MYFFEHLTPPTRKKVYEEVDQLLSMVDNEVSIVKVRTSVISFCPKKYPTRSINTSTCVG